METTKNAHQLQHQYSNGTWADVPDDRLEDHLMGLQRQNGPDERGTLVPRFCATRDATRDEVLIALDQGEELRNAPKDWYSVSRYKPTAQPAWLDTQTSQGFSGELWQECETSGCDTEPVCVTCFCCRDHCTC